MEFRPTVPLDHPDYAHDPADRRSASLAGMPGMRSAIWQAVFIEGNRQAVCLPPVFECGLRLPIPEESPRLVPPLTTLAETEPQPSDAIENDRSYGLPVSYSKSFQSVI
jgi:hypothetical protein